MAKFLNTSATNYFLEELIKTAKDRLILISPFLKLNDRVKELLQDKNRLKIDVRIVYGKNELQPEESTGCVSCPMCARASARTFMPSAISTKNPASSPA